MQEHERIGQTAPSKNMATSELGELPRHRTWRSPCDTERALLEKTCEAELVDVEK